MQAAASEPVNVPEMKGVVAAELERGEQLEIPKRKEWRELDSIPKRSLDLVFAAEKAERKENCSPPPKNFAGSHMQPKR